MDFQKIGTGTANPGRPIVNHLFDYVEPALSNAANYMKSQDYREAIKLYESLAELNVAQARLALGDIYLEGLSVEKNYEKAVQCFTDAINNAQPSLSKKEQRNVALCHYRIGVLYHYGRGVEKNDKLAIQHFNNAAEKECAGAHIALGMIYFKGGSHGVNKDHEAALRCFNQAVQFKANMTAMAYKNMASIYLDRAKAPSASCQSQHDNYVSAIHCYNEAINVLKVDAQENVAQQGKAFQQIDQINHIKIPEIEALLAPAQLQLGINYMEGRDVKKNDKVAYNYLIGACKNGGFSEAADRIGQLLDNPSWHEKASDGGDASFALATANIRSAKTLSMGFKHLVQNGEANLKSAIQHAEKFLQRAYILGHPQAALTAGEWYEDRQEFVKAKEWYNNAINQNPSDTKTKEKLHNIEIREQKENEKQQKLAATERQKQLEREARAEEARAGRVDKAISASLKLAQRGNNTVVEHIDDEAL